MRHISVYYPLQAYMSETDEFMYYLYLVTKIYSRAAISAKHFLKVWFVVIWGGPYRHFELNYFSH